MSRITDYILEPNVVYTNGAFLIKVKVQDSYKYKKYLVSEDIKYTTVNGTTFTLTNVKDGQPGSILQLEGNTTQNGTPSPSSPIPISTVSGDNEVLVRGKNLFNKDDVENNKRLDSSGQPISSSASGFSLTNYIKVQPNTKYTLSRNITSSSYYVNICEYTSDKTHIQRLYKAGDTTTTFTFTTPSNCEYLRINDATTNLYSVQLELRRNCYNIRTLYR